MHIYIERERETYIYIYIYLCIYIYIYLCVYIYIYILSPIKVLISLYTKSLDPPSTFPANPGNGGLRMHWRPVRGGGPSSFSEPIDKGLTLVGEGLGC